MMNLIGRESSLAGDRFEAWIRQKHQERVLSGQTVQSGPCPDEGFLRSLARRPRAIPLSDPRIDHAANCAKCMSRLMVLREEHKSRNRKLVFALATALCLIVAAGLFGWSRYSAHQQQMLASAPPVPQTVDLWNAGTYRGEQPGQLQSVVLPAARVRLTIILPRFSLPGQYLVAVTRDQSGNGVIAEGIASAGTGNGLEKISVDIDLRSAKAGAYFLSTTHEQDQAAYYYPLRIK
jgi:hypothetical protein